MAPGPLSGLHRNKAIRQSPSSRFRQPKPSQQGQWTHFHLPRHAFTSAGERRLRYRRVLRTRSPIRPADVAQASQRRLHVRRTRSPINPTTGHSPIKSYDLSKVRPSQRLPTSMQQPHERHLRHRRWSACSNNQTPSISSGSLLRHPEHPHSTPPSETEPCGLLKPHWMPSWHLQR